MKLETSALNLFYPDLPCSRYPNSLDNEDYFFLSEHLDESTQFFINLSGPDAIIRSYMLNILFP